VTKVDRKATERRPREEATEWRGNLEERRGYPKVIVRPSIGDQVATKRRPEGDQEATGRRPIGDGKAIERR
jgi:phage baseplate assembly protein gpV